MEISSKELVEILGYVQNGIDGPLVEKNPYAIIDSYEDLIMELIAYLHSVQDQKKVSPKEVQKLREKWIKLKVHYG